MFLFQTYQHILAQVQSVTITAEQLSALLALVVSLALSYVPPFKTWYEPLPNQQKVTWMVLFMLVVAAGSLAWECRSALATCIPASLESYLAAVWTALITSQGSYLLFVKPFPKKK